LLYDSHITCYNKQINMSIKKNKIFTSFRLDAEVFNMIKELPKKDPLVFQSQAKIIDAALYHFVCLSKSKQKEVILKYLTKNL